MAGLALFFWTVALLQAQDRVARIWVEDAELCPGQTADLGVFVDLGSNPVPLDNFMFYLNVADTSALTVVTHDWSEQSDGAFMGQPVLTEVIPAIGQAGSLVYNYIENRAMQGSDGGKQGVFACVWVDGSGRNGFVPDPSQPLFRIRVRCEEQRSSQLVFQPRTLAFSTGLEFMGGFYYQFPSSNIGNGTITPGKGPDKSTISAGPDTYMCVGERINFNAEGGYSYQWSQVYNPAIGGYQDEYLTNADTKQPTFLPLSAGPFVYQVAVANQQGCYTLDTVNYFVSQNHINNQIFPDNVLVDSGSSALFQARATTLRDLYPVKVTFTPDTLFAPGENVLYLTQNNPEGQISSLPVTEPALVVAHYEDKYCAAQSASRVYVRGVDVSGRIAPFPVYRCGNDTEDKSIQLNLLTSGGSGKFLYNWHVEDLEFGEAGDPWLDNPYSRNPRLWYIGRCAVSVDVLDMETGQTVTISDTMVYKDWVHAEVEIVLDTLGSGLDEQSAGGPFCENTLLRYKALARNPGSEPEYHWRVNGIWQMGSEEGSFATTMRKGDSVDVVLYSSENCVAEKAVTSNRLSPAIYYPSVLTVHPANVSTGEMLEACADSMELQVIYRNAGHNFRLQWWRNDRERIYDNWVQVADPDSGSYNVTFPRMGFYDGFSCSVSGSDMPCVAFDSVMSEMLYVNWVTGGTSGGSGSGTASGSFVFHPSRNVEAGEAAMQGEGWACGQEPFTVVADARYLPRDFVLMWYKKAGQDSVLLGYYQYDAEGSLQAPLAALSEEERLSCDLASVSMGYGYGKSMAAVRNMVKDGFKLVLNDPDDFLPARQGIGRQDTLFYVVYSTSSVCGREPHSARSPYFSPLVMEFKDYPGEIAVRKIGEERVCPATPLVLAASCGEDFPEDLRYEWYLTGHSVTDTFGDYNRYFTVKGSRGDTLEVSRAFQNMRLLCRALSDQGCGTGFPKETVVSFQDWVFPSTPFRIVHNPDTIVCEGAEIRNWAYVEEFDFADPEKLSQEALDGPGRALRGDSPGVRVSGRKARQYAISWSLSLDALLDEASAPEGTVHAGGEFRHVPQSNGSDSTGKGDLADTKGITTYYVRASGQSGCVLYDSVQVLMARAYRLSASLDYVLPAPWCDSARMENGDALRLVEGEPYVPGAQYAVLKIGNGGDSPLWQWGLNQDAFGYSQQDTIRLLGAPDGDTLWAQVTTSMLTCLDRTAKASVVLQKAEPGILQTNAPAWAASGEDLLLQAGVTWQGPGSPNLTDWLHGYSYSWWSQAEDGSWIPLASGQAGSGMFGLDTLHAVMPAHGGMFRVEARDRYESCPAVSSTIKVEMAVPTGVDLKVRDLATGMFVEGFCGMGGDFVLASEPGTDGETAYVSGVSGRVRLEAFPQNATGKAYVGFYKNGDLLGMGPVGTLPAENFPDQGDAGFEVLADGHSMETVLAPGDVIGAFYVHDTISLDGAATHYSPRLEFTEMAPNGALDLVAEPEVVCPGETVDLRASFPEMTGLESQLPAWEPQDALQGDPQGWQATGKPEGETLYSVSARDGFGCLWTDSARVFVAEPGSGLPLDAGSADTLFCGDKAWAEILLRVPGSSAGLEELFFPAYGFLMDEAGRVKAADSGFGPFRFEVSDGDRFVAKALPRVDCAPGFSVSDTLYFASVPLPRLRRVCPEHDTLACPGSEVRVEYEVQPSDAAWEWRSSLTFVEDEGLSRTYRADFPAMVVFRAMAPGSLVCAVEDSLQVELAVVPEAPVLQLSADREAVCGPEEVAFHLRAANCDTLIWHAGGQEVLRDALSLVRVPPVTGIHGPADSVYVVGIQAAGLCHGPVRAVSPVIAVYRVEKPVLEVLTPDTTVMEGSDLLLRARSSVYDGQEASLAWFDGDGALLSSQGEVWLEVVEPDVFHVMARQVELGTELPECFSVDSVRVDVRSPETGQDPFVFTGIYLPNTVIPGSDRPDDACLRVYGEGVGQVRMQVYDATGVLLFDQTGPDVAWRAVDMLGVPVPAGNYACHVRVWMEDGRVLEKQAVVTVVR